MCAGMRRVLVEGDAEDHTATLYPWNDFHLDPIVRDFHPGSELIDHALRPRHRNNVRRPNPHDGIPTTRGLGRLQHRTNRLATYLRALSEAVVYQPSQLISEIGEN